MKENKQILKTYALPALAFICLVFFYLFDIGNINALRQGTEGFYLQITREMFQKKSWIVPLYLGNNHWSKPPMHFWLGIFAYFFTGSTALWASRISTALLSLTGLFFFSKWIRKQLEIPFIYTTLFIGCSLGMLKYSRIFMMEIPLTIFSVGASLIFFDYLQSKKIINLCFASLLLTFATLVKGPVALVMCLGGSSLYCFIKYYKHKINYIKPLFLWSISSIALSSIWFLLCWNTYGDEFFQYFFIRENFGKFSTHSYPIISVFLGLALYGLPWTLFIPYCKLSLKNIPSKKLDPIIFLFANFLFFFILWLIPNQRSHHYAIPSLPFFLMLMLYFHYYGKPNKFFLYLGNILLSILLLIILILSAFILYLTGLQHLLTIIALIISLIIMFETFIRNRNLTIRSLVTLIFFGILWIFFIPSLNLPLIPKNILKKLKFQPVSTIYRKPYYIEEIVGRKVHAIATPHFYAHMYITKGHTIMPKNVFLELQLNKLLLPENTWKVWRRNLQFSDFKKSYLKQNLELLKEEMVLIKNISK